MNPEEREWLAQEAAASFERTDTSPHGLDSLAADYVAIARALREPIEMQLPADFARRVAALASARPLSVEVESGTEQRLLLGLGVALGLAALLAAIVYGSSWFGASMNLFSLLGKPSLSLLMSLLGCLGISAFSQHLRRWLDGHRPYA